MDHVQFLKVEPGDRLLNVAYVKTIFSEVVEDIVTDTDGNESIERSYFIKALTSDDEEVTLATFQSFQAYRAAIDWYIETLEAV